MKRTDYINRNDGQFYFDTTKKEILSDWDLHRKPPVLIPASQWTRAEWEQALPQLVFALKKRS